MQQRTQSFTSSPYQHTVVYPSPHESFSHDNTGSPNGIELFNERVSFQNFGHDSSVHRAQSAPMDLVDLWSFEAPACASPLSTSSFTSHAESMHSPPYTGLPMYDTLETASPHTQASLANNGTCTSGSESLWPCSYSETTPWDSPPFVLPYQNVPNYEQPPFELTQGFQSQPQGSASVPYLAYIESLPYPMEQTGGSPTLNAEASGSNGRGGDDDDDELSDSDSDESSWEDFGSSPISSHAVCRRSQANASVFRVEGWSANMLPFNATPDRKNVCPVLVGPNRNLPCPKRFQRPEHLRRHIRTVHGIGLEKVNYCKVPGCGAPFPRSDNFRQHYLTHLTKGKRKGNNEKISFQRMKEILGPKEKQLQRWLKMKLKQT